MLTTYWAAKGGSGTTVVAAAHAVHAAAAGQRTLVVDLAGDLPAVLGCASTGSGVVDWLGAGDHVPADAFDRLCVPVSPGLHLLPLGQDRTPADLVSCPAGRVPVLVSLLGQWGDLVVVDAGTRPATAIRPFVTEALRSVLVTRACYLSLRHQHRLGLRPTEVALVREPHRALGPDDISQAVGAPVRSIVPYDAAIARAVDAGLLATRLPRSLTRSFRLASAPCP